ncbi:MAG: sigma-70 family RNA polymerase sigma factor [Polyangiaceae bacterium]
MPPLDGASFEDSYRRVFPLVLAKCRRMLRGHADAHDVAQEVFVRLWKHRELINDQRALIAWLYLTSTRLVIDRARQRKLGRESMAHLERSVATHTSEAGEERFASRQQLRSLLSEVPVKELEAAILNRLDRLSHLEVAQVMGIGERTVRRLLDRFDQRAGALRESVR